MLLVLEMDVADLAATRFAISPLCETLKAVQLLGRPDPPPVNRPWIRWARGQLDRRPLRLPRLWPLVVTDLPYWLAGGGARSLFGDLHADLRWSAGKLFLADSDSDSGSGSGSGSGEGRAESQVTLGPDGVVLMPSVFIWPEWSVKRATSTQTTLMYPARGAATVWEADLSAAGLGDSWSGPGLGAGVSDREEAAEALLGAPRARLLGALRSPATTSALARHFGVTPSAVS
jgi:hypothetical protein